MLKLFSRQASHEVAVSPLNVSFGHPAIGDDKEREVGATVGACRLVPHSMTSGGGVPMHGAPAGL